MTAIRRLRLILATLLLLGATACTGTGINAGEEGGKAFIAFAGMLLVTVIVLAIVLGKEE